MVRQRERQMKKEEREIDCKRQTEMRDKDGDTVRHRHEQIESTDRHSDNAGRQNKLVPALVFKVAL